LTEEPTDIKKNRALFGGSLANFDCSKGKAFEKEICTLSNVLVYVCVILLLFMLLLGVADVMGRYLFRKPIIGTLEAFEILLPAIVLLSLAYTQRSKGHITVDLFISHLPPKARAILGFATTSWAIILFGLIGWQGIVLSLSYRETERVITNIRVPMFLPRLLVPVGAFAMCLVLIVDLLHCISQIRKRG
jgi:TRAP-type C4-dicarboxylate transport system permease small subunit